MCHCARRDLFICATTARGLFTQAGGVKARRSQQGKKKNPNQNKTKHLSRLIFDVMTLDFTGGWFENLPYQTNRCDLSEVRLDRRH